MKRILLSLLLISTIINFIGALGPELGFDALWYHLTIPKIYLMWEKIAFIPGGLLYYSAMPRLGELIFYLGKANDTFAHLVCWGAGIGTAFLTFKLARKYLDQKFSLLAALIFYATPLVGWQSGSAYVDLLRTFFEILALYLLLNKKFFWAGIAVGLAISTKTLSIGSLGILVVVGVIGDVRDLRDLRERKKEILKRLFSFLVPAVVIAAPWFIWSYNATGFPFYPIGTGLLNLNGHSSIINLFIEDKINPIYLALVPFLVGALRLRSGQVKKALQLTVYTALTFLTWILTPQSGGGRFLLPYLPAWAVLTAVIISEMRAVGDLGVLRKLLILVAVLWAAGSVGYRGVANLKVISYILGQETKIEYLCNHLDFSTRVFVDCDGWFAGNIKPTDLVLVKGFHNLYYVGFPYVHESWYKGEKVEYVVSYGGCEGFGGCGGTRVHENQLTGTVVYKL